MDLKFVNSMIRKSRYNNEVNPVQMKNMKIPISLNLELVYPNMVREGSVFLLVNRTEIGNPIQRFELYIEQVCTFRIVDLEEGFDTSRENMQKFISLICHPIALKEMQKAADTLTALYGIQQIKLPTSMEQKTQQQNNVLDMSGIGRPN